MPKQHQRPIYMLIFNDLLKKHNQAQPKYEPTQSDKKKANVERPSVSFSNPSAPSVNPAATIESSAPLQGTSAATQTVSASGQPSVSRGTSSASAQSDRASQDQSPSVSRSSNASGRKTASNQSISQGSGSVQASNRLFNPSMAPKQTTRTPPPFQKPKAHKIVVQRPASTSGKQTGSASAPSVSQTPIAVLGNSNSLPPERRRSPSPNLRTSHSSMAKTIAAHTPHAFKTLGPGFNNKAPAEKSLNPTPGDGHSLSSTIVPSDYEHIYHAPSQISDLPGVNETVNQDESAAHKPKRKKRNHHSRTHNH